jgi:hypothetical protein
VPYPMVATIPQANLALVGEAAERAARRLRIPNKVICDTLHISESEWSTQKWRRGINITRLTLLGTPFIRTFNQIILEEMGDAELPSQRDQWEGLRQLQAEYTALRADFADLWRRVTAEKTEVA